MKEEHPLTVFLALLCVYVNSPPEIRPIVDHHLNLWPLVSMITGSGER
jgi:hypothetical protein